MIRVVIVGACGRVGREHISVFSRDKGIRIVGAVERFDSKLMGMDAGNAAGVEPIGVPITDNLEETVKKSDVIVDFTNPENSLRTVEIAAKHGKGVVIGTTGFSSAQRKSLLKHADTIPILISPNMSQGMNILFHLVKKAAELFGDDYDVEIFEIHHNQKIDAPSGTAMRFGRLISEARGKRLEDIGVFGRKGVTGKRSKEEIGIMALRLGDTVGDHTVLFGGNGERIEFTHRSTSRKNYSAGALKAVKFLHTKKNGLYGMEDVLGLE
ncbi:MAG: 4-hydroxy-tetrahydrodipicolinate reductase [Spirochaetes bacterium]|nr:4-hydroxy-tetrahydrodipicolinate reductase [Spirochaetota bacterium]